MNILVLGSGAREHAIATKFKESNRVEKVVVSPGNGGIEIDFECVELNSFSIIAEYVFNNKIDIVFVGPEQPLSEGIVDYLQERKIKVIGPSRKASQIESSKSFAKELMKKCDVPTADYEVFFSYDDAHKYIQTCKFPVVYKADGLAAGKGVVIIENKEQAESELKEFMLDSKFGSAGAILVIEEFLVGWETSLFAFCDGTNFITTVFSMDHKQLGENDLGPNTGGMGAIAPIIEAERYKYDIEKSVFAPILAEMKEQGMPYSGVLYCGLMITESGAKVIEFNCRFGDPETQVVLPLLKSDFVDVCEGILNENITDVNLLWEDQFAVNIVLASGGYPASYKKGYEIELPELEEGSKIYFAGVKKKNEKLLTNGGRVLGITQLGYHREDVIKKAYKYSDMIKFTDRVCRRDIGNRSNR
ncbi:MAG: phosphoribosylamine--glycine ligase [Candidatus Cloacimonetes bacterium 4572_65]|nr:MAG: phosphoribosylamine--glycine ligase [Candidatus Cloacimonetes bacterium 4572_65]